MLGLVNARATNHNHAETCGGRIDVQLYYEREHAKSFVNDLILCRGDVSIRAATILRDAESYPQQT